MDNLTSQFNQVLEWSSQWPDYLRARLLERLQASEPVQVTDEDISGDDEPLTPDEIKELLTVTPKTGKEIVEGGYTGGWKDADFLEGKTSVEWVREQRSKRRYQW